MSVRRRLLLVSLATLAVGLGALLVGGNALLRRGVGTETSSLLRARAQTQLAALEVRHGRLIVRETANDAVLDRQAWLFDHGRVVERPAAAPPGLDRVALTLGRQGRPAERSGPGDVQLRAQPVRDGSGRAVGAVVVALSVRQLEDLEESVLIGSVVVAALVLLLGGLAIRAAVDGALRPVAHMAATAEDWSAHDLDRRFDLGPPRDELTSLASMLDGLLARIAASRRHEQRFASEVAHELRTPIAGLRGRAELALAADGPRADALQAEALRAVVADAERLDHVIDVLMAMARQEIDPGASTVDLAAIAREVEGVEVLAPSGLPQAEGEPAVVRRALAPLVDNARRHARRRVTLRLSATGRSVRLEVRDDGPGLDPALGERAFEAGARGSSAPDGGGAGLGLPLSRRLARSCGGDVVVGDGPGGCFVLELPAVGTAVAELAVR